MMILKRKSSKKYDPKMVKDNEVIYKHVEKDNNPNSINEENEKRTSTRICKSNRSCSISSNISGLVEEKRISWPSRCRCYEDYA